VKDVFGDVCSDASGDMCNEVCSNDDDNDDEDLYCCRARIYLCARCNNMLRAL